MGLDRRHRLLLVDDNEFERLMLRHHLRRDEHQILEAGDGLTALQIARNSSPDAILLDINMPELDGYGVLKYLREDSLTRSIPVIFLTGQTGTEMKVRALDLGANDYVTKPFDPAELKARLRVALRHKFCQDLLEVRAHIDALTGLSNRHALDARLESEWAVWRRRGGALSMIVLDLDHFKQINDRHGHSAGDEVLKRVSEAFRAVARASDTVARYGGEEFLLLAPDCDLPGAIHLAERAREQIGSLSFRFGTVGVRVSASVGVATVVSRPSRLDDADTLTLFARADRALYDAKTSGRNAVWAWCPVALKPVRGSQIHVPIAG